MSRNEFENRTALVTGGSRGIGRAVCLALAESGARVAINYRSDEKAAAATLADVETRGARAIAVKADVSDPDAVSEMVTTVEKELGPIDLLVTSAGIVRSEDHTEMEFAHWRKMMAVNVDGTYLSVMAVKDGMIARGSGRIVCISSIAGLRPRGRMLTYSTSKAAVIGFVRSCADAFGPAIRINSVAPGLIATDMTVSMDAATKQRFTDDAFLKRLGQPEEIAETVIFLLSERASFTTGQTYVVDGGRVTLP
jgi:3-oxoacyl-[acyl-carrier protein] reductase